MTGLPISIPPAVPPVSVVELPPSTFTSVAGAASLAASTAVLGVSPASPPSPPASPTPSRAASANGPPRSVLGEGDTPRSSPQADISVATMRRPPHDLKDCRHFIFLSVREPVLAAPTLKPCATENLAQNARVPPARWPSHTISGGTATGTGGVHQVVLWQTHKRHEGHPRAAAISPQLVNLRRFSSVPWWRWPPRTRLDRWPRAPNPTAGWPASAASVASCRRRVIARTRWWPAAGSSAREPRPRTSGWRWQRW